MDKNELLSHLKEARRTEESAVRVYMKHLKAIVQRSGLANDKIESIRKVIEPLIEENKRHHKIVDTLITRLQEGFYDDNP